MPKSLKVTLANEVLRAQHIEVKSKQVSPRVNSRIHAFSSLSIIPPWRRNSLSLYRLGGGWFWAMATRSHFP